MKVLWSPLILNSDSCHDHLQFPMTSLLEQLSYYKVVDYQVLSFSILHSPIAHIVLLEKLFPVNHR